MVDLVPSAAFYMFEFLDTPPQWNNPSEIQVLFPLLGLCTLRATGAVNDISDSAQVSLQGLFGYERSWPS
jgi:hypothetical protein